MNKRVRKLLSDMVLKEKSSFIFISNSYQNTFRWKKGLQCVKAKLEENVSEYLTDFLKAQDIKIQKELRKSLKKHQLSTKKFRISVYQFTVNVKDKP